MNRVYKYTLEVAHTQTISLPWGASVLSVAEQRGEIVLYAMVNTLQKQFERAPIFIHGTGFDVDPGAVRFIGTVKMHDGTLMFHVFEGHRENE